MHNWIRASISWFSFGCLHGLKKQFWEWILKLHWSITPWQRTEYSRNNIFSESRHFQLFSFINAWIKPTCWPRAALWCPAKLQSNVCCDFKNHWWWRFQMWNALRLPLLVRATAWQIESVTLHKLTDDLFSVLWVTLVSHIPCLSGILRQEYLYIPKK